VKFKLDENIGRRGRELLRASGHDVVTVWDQGLHGVTDEQLFKICSTEGRALVTLDRDFGIFGDNFPGSALVTITALANPDAKVEIQGYAVIGSK
jgi:predicted nuclease of predicted toxin-antitoxin system